MKMTNDMGPQVLPTSFGPSVKLGLDSGPQINGGPNTGFTPTMKPGDDFTGPQINPGPPRENKPFDLLQIFRGGVAAGPAIVPRPQQRSRFFPATTGTGMATVRSVDAYQGGPAGRMNAFGVRSGWTWGQ